MKRESKSFLVFLCQPLSNEEFQRFMKRRAEQPFKKVWTIKSRFDKLRCSDGRQNFSLTKEESSGIIFMLCEESRRSASHLMAKAYKVLISFISD